MREHMVVKIRWRKSRSKDEETKGSPICSIHVNESEVVSVMAPGQTEENIKRIRRYAIFLWLESYFGENAVKRIEDEPNITEDVLKRTLSQEGYDLLSTTEEGGLEIYFVVQQGK